MTKKKAISPKQERFAIAVASGKTLKESAKDAGYKGSRSSACEIAQNPNISERIQELRNKTEKVLECSRDTFVRTIHGRFMNDEHPKADKYADILAKVQGWYEPQKIDISTNMVVEITIGGKPLHATQDQTEL